MRGADLLVKALVNGGVDTIFTLSGNQIMPIFDACVDAGINLIHVRHEGAAVYMAEGYAQITGRVGVALDSCARIWQCGRSNLYGAHERIPSPRLEWRFTARYGR